MIRFGKTPLPGQPECGKEVDPEPTELAVLQAPNYGTKKSKMDV